MEMFRKHTSPLLVIIAGLLYCIATADAQSPIIYTLCQLSTPALLRVTPTSQPFIIQSPNYGYGSYPNNLNCTLTIASGAEPMVLSFEYRVFNLEVAQDCVFDYLCVVGVKFCGKWATGRMFQRILPPRSTSTVHFHTDSSVALNGFYIIVTSQPVLPIHEVEGSGWASENITYVPRTYYPGMPYTDGCSQNSVQQATYYFCNNVQSNNYIDINSNSSPFLIRSPNYGGSSYGNNLNCSVVIRSGAQPLVLSLRITDFQVEYSGTCYYDYLCVHGTWFCGAWLNGYTFQYILPANSRFTTTFKTDSSVTQRGFEIEISQALATTNQIVRQPSGNYASSNASLSYTWETYHPGYPYSDRCVAASRVVPTTSGSWTPQ